MAMVGEQAWYAWAYNFGNDLFTMTFDIDMPPSNAFFKVFQGHYFELDNTGAVDIGVINMRRRLPDNSDETVDFPDIDSFGSLHTAYDPAMTHVTYGLKVRACSSSLVWTLGFWA